MVDGVTTKPAWPLANDLLRPGSGALEEALRRVTVCPDDLDAVLAASSDPLIAFDENRRILRANPGAVELFGYAPGALDGASTDVLLPARLRQPQAPPMVPTPDIMQVDLPGLRRDGSEMSIEWVVGSAVSESGAIFVMTVRDRAAADRALDALRASEERFRLLVDGVPDFAVFMLDATGHVATWNKGAERTKGWTADEIIGAPYEVFFLPEDRAAGLPAELLAKAVRDGSQDLTGWRVRKDGRRFHAGVYLSPLRSPSGELRGFAKVTRDLTAKFEAEDLERRLSAERLGREAAEAAAIQVRASEARVRRLQKVTAALSEAATPADVARVMLDQSLDGLGAAASAIYALAPGADELEILDQRGHPPQDLAKFARIPLTLRAPLADAARERAPSFYESFEQCAALYPQLRHAIASGGFEASAALPLITRGVVLGVLGIRFREARPFDAGERALFVTLSELCAQALERARLLAAETKARSEAEAASRAKDEFLAILGHELRNPLAPIVTALTLMKLRGDKPSEKERTIIERQVAHLVRLVDDLLDVSRIARGKVELKEERLELADIVAAAVELSSPLLEQHGHHLSVAVASRGLAVDGDPTRLAQVVSNLLTNSAKYTPPGGHIEVSGSLEQGRTVLRVKDDGIGIAPTMLTRVFDLFAQEHQTIDRSHGGLGLGLSIVKNLVTLHGGTASAFSEGPGKGSVFTIELPAAAGISSSACAKATPNERLGRARPRVLVVDDNPDAAELLADALMANGHAVMTAHDGLRALQLAESFRPDVAVLDIGLPVMDGYELARKLKDLLGTVRLIAVTGYGQLEDQAQAHRAGFDVHLVKPVDFEALASSLA